jgi:hypothetical protein
MPNAVLAFNVSNQMPKPHAMGNETKPHMKKSRENSIRSPNPNFVKHTAKIERGGKY